MILVKRFVLGMLLLVCLRMVCLRAAVAQDQVTQTEAIASALRAGEFSRAVELTPRCVTKFSQQRRAVGDARRRLRGGRKQGGSAEFVTASRSRFLPTISRRCVGRRRSNTTPAVRRRFPFYGICLRLHPADQTSHGMLAVLEYQQGNCADAVIHFKRPERCLTRNPMAYMHMPPAW